MKKIWLMFLFCGSIVSARGQSFEVQQLLLNVEKLAQFKQILRDLEKGYRILAKGYTTIRDISQGNFNLHDLFLDALWEVSPAVKRYQRVAAIIQSQARLVREYKTAWRRAQTSGLFTTREIDYMGRVYARLFQESVQSLEDLLLVLTPRQLRMSDDERLAAIDRIEGTVQQLLMRLRRFTGDNAVLEAQRRSAQQDVNAVRQFYRQP